MIRTIIFDMDGVLVDTEPLHHDAFFRHFAELGIPMSREEYATFLGSSTRNVYQLLKQQFNLTEDVETLIQRKREHFARAFEADTTLELLPGARALIEELHRAGVPLQLASSASKETIGRVFGRFGLYPYFDNLVSGEDFPKSKPDPAIFLHAAALAGLAPAECLVIEDSANGVTAAKAAGMYCVGYRSEHSEGQDLHHADHVVAHLGQLKAAQLLAMGRES
ncbi:haloacid dehalogenase superfamily, subfamily IA, variant 3 with third motif having DD or ED/haloacid dehalogenase superfamily, subfamily IA, variant 1 with third motif having Dx(3-4)D or Dx(3-4)E [Hymenobacter daecheongensis DSM 21074]|uniref:Haloacid dehalogenase superfamily, subfamily IA, variant 3 with third motif having DD or ED/haloacid dehalogenase superfamily, subfamily IA, variant 1 with third motif having Dx(3-4)D or Dx(3-4)E n=1 Tax=Hymenobacter daecheongensis DSM 21074 TaxID=1121955 RepID=A0A1M6HM99_9BACT|nr:HAD family hydrolase [Hymenobacter daecheongensis]SHJ23361.1 haloacid dehalogenase superfamily, subfamily IA, variant 3 with third motif having DD or ED/haloacid dehalogenase superfamily, subfamily IA, variant 1 with third motif having Dx(3-4)D or Dx(3-4)E [Hymenobacter daecheongensis DSM 21074]